MPFLSDNPTARLKMLEWLLHGTGLVILVAAGVAGYCLVHLPLAEKQRVCVAQIAVLDGLLEHSGEIRATHSRFKDSLAKIRDRADALRERIPDRPRETEFLEQMNEAANEEGLNIRDYRRGAVMVKDTHSHLDVHVSCAGSYQQICGFLDSLAGLPRISTVEQATIISDSDAEGYPVELTLRLYYGKQERSKDKRRARND